MNNEIETFDDLYKSLVELHPNAEKTIDEDRLTIYLNDRYNKRISYWNGDEYNFGGYIIEHYIRKIDDYIGFSESNSAETIYNRIKALKDF